MIHEIFIVDNDDTFVNDLTEQFKNSKNFLLRCMSSDEIIEHLLDIPSLILIDEESIAKDELIKLCRLIRSNEDNSITPIMILTSNTDCCHEKAILKEEVEYYVKKPIDAECIFYMIKNIVKLLYRNRGISPLTKLPGNLPIQSELKKRLTKKQEFAVLYFDLDNFKAYNDTYGFLSGDEIIKETAKIIVKNINIDESTHNFIRTYWRR